MHDKLYKILYNLWLWFRQCKEKHFRTIFHHDIKVYCGGVLLENKLLATSCGKYIELHYLNTLRHAGAHLQLDGSMSHMITFHLAVFVLEYAATP